MRATVESVIKSVKMNEPEINREAHHAKFYI